MISINLLKCGQTAKSRKILLDGLLLLILRHQIEVDRGPDIDSHGCVVRGCGHEHSGKIALIDANRTSLVHGYEGVVIRLLDEIIAPGGHIVQPINTFPRIPGGGEKHVMGGEKTTGPTGRRETQTQFRPLLDRKTPRVEDPTIQPLPAAKEMMEWGLASKDQPEEPFALVERIRNDAISPPDCDLSASKSPVAWGTTLTPTVE